MYEYVLNHSNGLNTIVSDFKTKSRRKSTLNQSLQTMTSQSIIESLKMNREVYGNENKALGIPLLSFDSKITIEERRMLYNKGGIFFTTSRIFIQDLMSMEFDWNKCILYFIDVEDIITKFQLSFIAQVFLNLTKNEGKLRCFTQRVFKLTVNKTFYDDIKRIFGIQKTLFIPYAFTSLTEIRKRRTNFHVNHLKLQLDDNCRNIQDLIFKCMKLVTKELRDLLEVSEDDLTDKYILFNSYDKVVKMKYKNKITSEVESVLIDLKSLRQLLLSLYTYDPVMFYINLQAMKLLIWDDDSGYWIGSKEGQLIFKYTEYRIFKDSKFCIEPQNKHIEMKNIIEQENNKGNNVVIIVNNDETKNELINPYNKNTQVLEGIYQEWFDKKGELEKTLKELKLKDRNDASSKAKKWLLFQKQLYKPMNTNGTNIVQDENEDNESDDEVSIVDKKEMDSNDVIEVSYQTIIREITKKFYESKLGQLQQYKEDALTQQPVDDVESEINNHSINEYNEQIHQTIQIEEITKPINKIINQFDLNTVLYWDKPTTFICYNCSLWVTRVLDLYASEHGDKEIELFILHYNDSYEQIRYQKSILREKESYEQLVKQESQESQMKIEVSDKIKSNKDRKDIIYVDMREFRCELPYELFKQGFKLIPKQIEIGDYLLSPHVCVERKSLIDLVGSLKSKRIHKQIQNMIRKYSTPVLLLECYTTSYFQYHDSTNSESILKNSIFAFSDFMKEFPELKILWSYNPEMTAKYFKQLKQNEDQPQDSDCKKIQDDKGDYSWNAIEVIKRLPGISDDELNEIKKDKSMSLAKLLCMSDDNVHTFFNEDDLKKFNKGKNYEFK